MFDRIVLINLDKRQDRLGAFKAKIVGIPLLKDYVRYRAIHGDTVTVPGFFISGGGAYGCRQTHLRTLEDALLDGIETLLVLEDDVRFCPNFTEKLLDFMRRVPDDWNGLMLGGQDHDPQPTPTDVEGIVRSRNTQRTHAYVVRGREAMQDLYRLWARADRHIDHLFGVWQQKWNVYQPQPFLCGQDETPSDISGRNDTVRYWNPRLEKEQSKTEIVVLDAPRNVAEGLRTLGFHFGYSRDALTGKDKGLIKLATAQFPMDELTKWVDLVINEASDCNGIAGIWHMPEITGDFLRSRIIRPVRQVKADSVADAVRQMPSLLPAFLASQIVWCWKGKGVEILEGMKHHGWHRGEWKDAVTGLDNGVRAVVEEDKYGMLKQLLRGLEREIVGKMYGKVLLAHPDLNMDSVRHEFPDKKVIELIGSDIGTLVADYQRHVDQAMETYGAGK